MASPTLEATSTCVAPIAAFCKSRPELFRSRDPVHILPATMDVQKLVNEQKMELEREPGLTIAPYVMHELMPGDAVASDDALLEYAHGAGSTIYHSVGTCAMGHGPKSVVDPQLRVHGVKGLRVVDASIMPRLVSGNTDVSTIMIAEKASDMILGKAVAQAA